MGFAQSTPVCPNGEPAPDFSQLALSQDEQECRATTRKAKGVSRPQPHQPEPQLQSQLPRAAADSEQKKPVQLPPYAVSFEHEDITEIRRKLQVPELIANTVNFCDSLVRCYQQGNPDDKSFSEKFALLNREADYLTQRHKCIEENKGKGVMTREFVDKHLEEVSAWMKKVESFILSCYKRAD